MPPGEARNRQSAIISLLLVVIAPFFLGITSLIILSPFLSLVGIPTSIFGLQSKKLAYKRIALFSLILSIGELAFIGVMFFALLSTFTINWDNYQF